MSDDTIVGITQDRGSFITRAYYLYADASSKKCLSEMDYFRCYGDTACK